jgi:hypothetical protein
MKIIFHANDIPTIQKYMEQCGIQPCLWLQANEVGFIKPTTSYVLIDDEK